MGVNKMELSYKLFTQDTLADVQQLVAARFGEGGCKMAKHLLKNPLLMDGGGAAGDIAYRDGRPVCFMATMVRRAYLGHETLLCSVGGMFCKAERGCPLPAMIEVMERMGGDHYGCSYGFGNTSSPTAWGVNKEIGGVLGPATWLRSRFRVIHPIGLALGGFRRKILRQLPPVWKREDVAEVDGVVLFKSGDGVEVIRLKGIEAQDFDAFWEKYLLGNKGFVISRTSAELEWVFGERIREGRCLVFAAYSGDVMMGWMIISPFKKSPRRWIIVDCLALNNDKDILLAMSRAVVKFLKTRTNAWTLETRGFPMWFDSVIKRVLPFTIRHKDNPYFYFPQQNEISNRICMALNQSESWFFGLYDGDGCMCV